MKKGKIIKKTQGFVFRKVFHIIINGLIAWGVYYLLPEYIVPIAALAFVVILGFELIRLMSPARKYVLDAINPILKKTERKRFSGVFWISFAALLISPMSSPFTISYAFAVFALADPMAALVGKYSKSKKIFPNKTINGSLAFWASAIIVTLGYLLMITTVGNAIFWAVIIGAVLTIIEIFSHPLDDNFTLPVAAGIIMKLFI